MLNGLVKPYAFSLFHSPRRNLLHIPGFNSSPSQPALRAMSSSTDTSAPTSSPRRLRILLVHGFTQSGPLFHAKTRALEKSLRKAFPHPRYAVSLVYPTAPILIKPSDAPGAPPSDGTAEDAYGWWRRKELDGGETPNGRTEGPGYVYEGIEQGLARVAEHLVAPGEDGERGFDGVIGFSQGGCLAGFVASLLEPGRRESMDAAKADGGIGYPECFLDADGAAVVHPPLRFAVSYSGFAPPPNPLYDAFYSPKIATPMLHFLGTVDTVVEESRSVRLVDSCNVDKESEVGKRRVVYHPGGHFLPSGKMALTSLISFIQETMGWQEGINGAKDKEELDLPF